jgi:hypothetical protein
MGKWSNLKEKFVRFVQEPSYQQLVDKQKQVYLPMSRLDRCVQLMEARKKKDELEDLVKLRNIEIEALNQLLVEDLEGEDESKVTNTAGTFSIRDSPYPQVKDRVAYLKWIREQDLEDLLTVNYQTTAGMVKDRIEKGEEIPPGIEVFVKTSIACYPPKPPQVVIQA